MKKVYTFLAIPIVLIALLYAQQSRGQELTFGEETTVQGFFCADGKYTTTVLSVHDTIGMAAARQVASMFVQQGVCAVASLPIRPVRIVKEYVGLEVPNGTLTFYHVEVQVGDGNLAHLVTVVLVKKRSDRNPS